MPKLDFDVINLGHGSGGLLTNKLLEAGVFDVLKNPLLDTHHDGAVLEMNGQMAFSTDSYVVSPVFFPGGNIGDLAVNGTVNDLAMCGAGAQYLSLAFILEEGLPMAEYWDILISIKNAAQRAGVQIITGDTKVVERGKGDKIFINTTGIGAIHPRADISMQRVRPGDRILISGHIATHGIVIMSVRQGVEFETTLTSDTANLNHTVLQLLDTFGPDIHLLRDPTRGGVATVLNEIARDAHLGVEIRQDRLPVLEEVAGACELLGFDPLYVANEGVFIAVAAPAAAEAMLEKLRSLEYGAHAQIVGEVVETHPRQVILHSQIGGRRVVNMLTGEQLPRIC
ncbi:MAG: hydrogenase expression/formation protein HypE [Saprospirales bacterium]|nr:hydrogenase expression/formation protein HypE [Saprospirales bacterium]MBK8923150.1 hydrogenase expression/formation protein HypE [Saprospirales bacterium]